MNITSQWITKNYAILFPATSNTSMVAELMCELEVMLSSLTLGSV